MCGDIALEKFKRKGTPSGEVEGEAARNGDEKWRVVFGGTDETKVLRSDPSPL